LFPFARNPLSFLVKINREYGDLACFRIRKRMVFLLTHPELIEGVLVTHQRNFVKNPGFQTIKRILGEGLLSSEGEFHLRQRRMIQPIFHKSRIASHGETMVAATKTATRNWQDGIVLDIAREMTSLTLAIIGRTLFNADVLLAADEISQALNDALTLFHHVNSPSAYLLDKFPFYRDRRFARGRERLDSTIYDIIDMHQQNPNGREDLISLLLGAQDAEGDGGEMTDLQIRDEALTIFLAGHETSAVMLTWFWHAVAHHPEVEGKLHRELELVLEDRPITVEDLPLLKYTRMILLETMRLYPPVYMLGRQALEDYPVRDALVPAGASIVLSPYITQRDPSLFPEPECFLPDRWTEEIRARRPHFAYFPFGGGAHVCIGEPFAWQEALMVVATLARRWRLSPLAGNTVALDPRVTLRPKGGLPMRLEQR
jgi:cytochrome P450